MTAILSFQDLEKLHSWMGEVYHLGVANARTQANYCVCFVSEVKDLGQVCYTYTHTLTYIHTHMHRNIHAYV